LEQGRAILGKRLARRGFTISAAMGAMLLTEKASKAAFDDCFLIIVEMTQLMSSKV